MLDQNLTVVKHFEKCAKSCGTFLRSEDTEDTFGNRSKSDSEDEFKIFVLSYLDSRHNKASKKTTFILPWGGVHVNPSWPPAYNDNLKGNCRDVSLISVRECYLDAYLNTPQ